jgi:outer membrane protein OmpA-like peptidoglycan-associated protein
MKRLFLFALCGFLLNATYAQTAVAKEHYTVSGGLLGAANLTEFRTDKNASPSVDYKTKLGWGFGGWLNLPISNGFSIEPQLMYNSYQYQTRSTTPDLLMYDGKIRYISLPILLKLHTGDHFAITLGPQFDFMSSIEDNNNVATEEQFKKTAVSLSGGLEVFPHGRVTVFGRYILGLTNVDDRADHGGSTREYKTSNIQLGLKFRLFGSKKTETTYQAAATPVPVDTDGDGIYDDADKCPTQFGTAKYNGCPVPDSDGDGINDELDKCPNQAGVAKYDGCPIPDSDGDGINDEEDKCPNQAGTAKYNGCPVPDRDNDGINDEEDKCPDIAGVTANNGCPEVPANVSKTLGIAGTHIAFSSGTKFTSSSNTSLDQVVTIMNENPGLRIKIEGHTDNAGDDAANMKLSQDRADAVKAYIVGKGISADRITSEGFGETMPIADNKTAAGRAKNRRIEIKMEY